MNESRFTSRLPRKLAGYAANRHSNLSPALILLPRDRQRDAFLFYDFCRTVDDIADTGTSTAEQRLELLDTWHASFQPECEEQLPVDFSEMIRRRGLDRHLLTEIVLGMKMDVSRQGEPVRYPDFESLRLYCWRVASAVGLVSATIFGAHGESVEQYAEQLGIALQLTNILRDVAEDAGKNRVYLPQEDLDRFGVNRQDILSGNASPSMTHLLNHQAERADAYFAKAELAWSSMSINQRRLMRPARLMSAIYRKLLLQMHRDRYDVFGRHYRVGRMSKLSSLLIVLLQRTH